MTATALTPEQEARAQDFAAVLQRATADDFVRIARLLVSKDEAHTFGQTEFQLRDLVLALGAKALHLGLAQKKTATRAPASPAPAAASRPASRATAPRRR
jgi:hypothetical protein